MNIINILNIVHKRSIASIINTLNIDNITDIERNQIFNTLCEKKLSTEARLFIEKTNSSHKYTNKTIRNMFALATQNQHIDKIFTLMNNDNIVNMVNIINIVNRKTIKNIINNLIFDNFTDIERNQIFNTLCEKMFYVESQIFIEKINTSHKYTNKTIHNMFSQADTFQHFDKLFELIDHDNNKDLFDCNTTDEFGNTILMNLIENTNEYIAIKFLEKFGDKYNLDHCNYENESIFIKTIRNIDNNTNLANILLTYYPQCCKKSIDLVFSQSTTLLMISCKSNVPYSLFKRIFKLYDKNYTPTLNANGESALLHACSNPYGNDAANDIIDMFGDKSLLKSRSTTQQATPFSQAFHNKLKVANRILTYYTDCDIWHTTNTNIFSNNIEITTTLLEKINPECANCNNYINFGKILFSLCKNNMSKLALDFYNLNTPQSKKLHHNSGSNTALSFALQHRMTELSLKLINNTEYYQSLNISQRNKATNFAQKNNMLIIINKLKEIHIENIILDRQNNDKIYEIQRITKLEEPPLTEIIDIIKGDDKYITINDLHKNTFQHNLQRYFGNDVINGLRKKLTNEIKSAKLNISCLCCLEKITSLVVLNPCHHVSVCTDCLKKINTCPSCRAPITNTTKIYMG